MAVGDGVALVWQDASIPKFLGHWHLVRSEAPNDGIFLFFSSGILIKKKNFTYNR